MRTAGAFARSRCSFRSCLLVFRLPPQLALFNAQAVVALLLVVGEAVEQGTGEVRTLSAVLVALALTAGLYGTGVAPKGLVNMYAALAAGIFPVRTLAAE